MNILALDLGTKMGYAARVGEQIVSGTWDFANKRFESGGMRFIRFRAALNELGLACGGHWDMVALEEVRRHMGVDAAHIYGGFLATLQAWCCENGMEYVGIPVGTIKKRATGKGNAQKPAMIDAAQRQWPNEKITDDNQADALWCLQCAIDSYDNGRNQS